MAEAMKRLHWEAFLNYLDTNGCKFRVDALNASVAEFVSEVGFAQNEVEKENPRLQEKLKVSQVLSEFLR